MWAGMPRNLAASASAMPWLPEDCVTTPREAVAASRRKMALVAPVRAPFLSRRTSSMMRIAWWVYGRIIRINIEREYRLGEITRRGS